MDAREIRASRRVVLAAVGRGINSGGFSRVPGRCQWCGRRGLCAKSNPTPLSDSLVCVTPVPPSSSGLLSDTSAPPTPRTVTGAWCVRLSVECGVVGASCALTPNPVPSTLFPAFFRLQIRSERHHQVCSKNYPFSYFFNPSIIRRAYY